MPRLYTKSNKSKLPKPSPSSSKGDAEKSFKLQPQNKKPNKNAPKTQPVTAASSTRDPGVTSPTRARKNSSYAKIQSKVAQFIRGVKSSGEKKEKPSRIPVPVRPAAHPPAKPIIAVTSTQAQVATNHSPPKQSQSEMTSRTPERESLQGATRSSELVKQEPKKSALPVLTRQPLPPNVEGTAAIRVPSLRLPSPTRPSLVTREAAVRRRAVSQGRLGAKESRFKSPPPRSCGRGAVAPRDSTDSESDTSFARRQVLAPAVKRSAQTQTLYSMMLFESRSNERLERERRALEMQQQRCNVKRANSISYIDHLKILQYNNSPRHFQTEPTASAAHAHLARNLSPRRPSPTRQVFNRLISPLKQHRNNRVSVQLPPKTTELGLNQMSARSDPMNDAQMSHRSSLGCLDMASSHYDDNLLRDVIRTVGDSSDVTTDEPFSEDSIESPSQISRMSPQAHNLPSYVKLGVKVLPDASDVMQSPRKAPRQSPVLAPVQPQPEPDPEVTESETESDVSMTSDDVEQLAMSVIDRYDNERQLALQHPVMDYVRAEERAEGVESWMLRSSSEDSFLGGTSVDKPPKALRRKMRDTEHARRSPSYTVRTRNEFPTYPECRRTFDVYECESTVDDFLYNSHELDRRHNDVNDANTTSLFQRIANSVESAWAPENSLQLMNMFSSFGDVMSTLPVLLIIGAQAKAHKGSSV